MQATQDNEELQAELSELTRSVTALREKLFDTEVELKINKMERQAQEDSMKDTLLMCSPEKRRALEDKVYTLEHELEELRWKLTGTEIAKIELINAKEISNREAIQARQAL